MSDRKNVKLNGITLWVGLDDYRPNPREECECVGKMVCWHRRYDLGDHNPFDKPRDFEEHINNLPEKVYKLPVYLLDHSALYVSTTSFNDPWDSGQVGYIYCTESDAKKGLGENVTPSEIIKQLEQEVKVYDHYLNGESYMYLIEGENGEGIDCCGGFDGDSYQKIIAAMKEVAGEEYHSLFDKFAITHLHFGV